LRRFIAVLSALALVAVVAGPTMAAKPVPAQTFTTTLTVDGNAAAGSYNGGFFVRTTGDGGFVNLGIKDTVAKPDLAAGSYPFYLKAGTGQRAALRAYFDAKVGWPDAYHAQINAEIAGMAPFFYLKSDGAGGYGIFDGFMFGLGAGEATLRVDNDYPTGTYLYVTGPLGLNGPGAQVKMKVERYYETATLSQSRLDYYQTRVDWGGPLWLAFVAGSGFTPGAQITFSVTFGITDPINANRLNSPLSHADGTGAFDTYPIYLSTDAYGMIYLSCSPQTITVTATDGTHLGAYTADVPACPV